LYTVIPTAASAIVVAQKVNQMTGGNNCGLTIDYGHQKMEATTASTACDLAEFAGVPVHKFDINDARQGRNDQDLMFGTISIPESVEYLYTTFVRNYQGWYSQDQFTYREDPTRAIERSMINFANLAAKAVRILAKQPALEKARTAGTGPDVLDVVSPVLVG
jgi:xylose isomerase